MTDISMVEHNEKAVSRLHHLMQLLPAGIVVLDERGRVEDANPQARLLLGTPLEGEAWRDVIARAFAPQADDGHEVSLHNGRRIRLATRALEPEPGQLVMLTDLTETRQLQRNVSHLERLSALGKMAASLAHQIRTPLSAALLYAANLGNPQLDASGQSRFQRKLMERLGELEQRVNDLLLFARGGHTQQLFSVTLDALLDRVIAGCEAQLERQGATLHRHTPPGIPIRANADALVGAIQNLVNNALEAGAKAIRLEAQVEGPWVTVRVMDNGQGMAAEQLSQAASPFFTTKANGTGLGLAVVQSICRSHGGRLELQSVPGQGSCISLVLPLEQRQTHSEPEKESVHE